MTKTLFFLSLICLHYGCGKHDTPAPAPPVVADNTWQCEIGGKLYSGPIDTSFSILTNQQGWRDTFVYLTGSTADAKANILFKLEINRTAMISDSLWIFSAGSTIQFDTASVNYLKTEASGATVKMKIEDFDGKGLNAGFAGRLSSITGALLPVTNGRISVQLGKGSNSSKFLEASVENSPVAGPLRSATLQTNTLIMDGTTFDGEKLYQLQVRTGATIKPGVYKSRDGDVGFNVWIPSIYTHYVSDSLGDLTVNILSVEGNVVKGSFTGTAFRVGSNGITVPLSGQFRCRVKDYAPVVDGPNQWKLSVDNQGQYPFRTFSGNTTQATLQQSGSRYGLTIKGISDNGATQFFLKLNSWSPFAPGIYPLTVFADSLYLNTPTFKYYNLNDRFYFRIDSINSSRVVGGFYGGVGMGYTLYGSGQYMTVRKGYFRGEF